MRFARFFTSFVGFLVALLVVSSSFRAEPVQAAALSSVSDTLSSYLTNTTGTTHTIGFTTATTDLMQEIMIRFSTVVNGSTKPGGLDVTSATLGTVSGLGPGWSIDTSAASSGIVYINRGTAQTVNASVAASIDIQNITNSSIEDCNPGSGILEDTCYVKVSTFSDNGNTLVDSGSAIYTLHEDPFFNFSIEDVPNGQTHNGVTSNISTTATSIAFGLMDSGVTRYGTQKITVATNAPHGYVVSAKVFDDWAGVRYVNNNIDPFGATNAAWVTPQNWSSPDGTSPNVNSGWFGGNTSDTRVTGWTSASGKFGPFNQNAHAIAVSTSPDPSGTVIYVSYAIEVNGLQAADDYSATLLFDVRPVF